VFIKYEAEVSSRVGGGERGVVDFGKLFTETNEQKFSQMHKFCVPQVIVVSDIFRYGGCVQNPLREISLRFCEPKIVQFSCF